MIHLKQDSVDDGLADIHTEILENIDRSSKIQEICGNLERSTRLLGFTHFHLQYNLYVTGRESSVGSLTNLSNGRNPTLQDYSPVLATLASEALDSLVPMLWAGPIQLQRESPDLSLPADSTMGAAIILAVHTPRGTGGFLALLSARPLNAEGPEFRNAKLYGPAIAQRTVNSVKSILFSSKNSVVGLTAREIETLRWVAAGKTSWEAGRLLGITKHGVSHHMRNVMRKLEVSSRLQAVQKAIALGLLTTRWWD